MKKSSVKLLAICLAGIMAFMSPQNPFAYSIAYANNYLNTILYHQEDEDNKNEDGSYKKNYCDDPTKNLFYDDIVNISIKALPQQKVARNEGFDAINYVREQKGLEPLIWDYKLEQAAIRTVEEKIITGILGAIRPNGEETDCVYLDIDNDGYMLRNLSGKFYGDLPLSSMSDENDFQFLINDIKTSNSLYNLLKPNMRYVGFAVVEFSKPMLSNEPDEDEYYHYCYYCMWFSNIPQINGDIDSCASEDGINEWQDITVETVKEEQNYTYTEWNSSKQEYVEKTYSVAPFTISGLLPPDSSINFNGSVSEKFNRIDGTHPLYLCISDTDDRTVNLYNDFDLYGMLSNDYRPVVLSHNSESVPVKYSFSVSDNTYAKIDENGNIFPLKTCTVDDGVKINVNYNGITSSFPLVISDPIDFSKYPCIIELDYDGEMYYVSNDSDGYEDCFFYTGKPITPKPKVTIPKWYGVVNFDNTVSQKALTEGVDYELEYSNNILPYDYSGNSGFAKVSVKGINRYCGECTKSFIINCNHDWDNGVITIQPTCTSTGLTTYKCKNCGKSYEAGVKATGHTWKKIADKEATCTEPAKEKYYCEKCSEVELQNVKDSKALGHTVVIDKAVSPTFEKTGKTEGSHCSVCNTVLKAQKTVPKLKPSPTKLINVSSPKTKQIKLTWKKQTKNMTGYEVQYSTSKNFNKGAKAFTTKKTSSTIKKLKKKQTYYVRIRTYKSIKGKKYYSDWSKSKTVKTK